jgi:hypothetical protein
MDPNIMLLCKEVYIRLEICQENPLSEISARHPRISREPVAHNFVFRCLHTDIHSWKKVKYGPQSEIPVYAPLHATRFLSHIGTFRHLIEVFMARSILLWTLALLITLGSAYYQRKTGPTYPVDGDVMVGAAEVHYSLTRTHGGDGDQPVPLHVLEGEVRGEIVYKRYKTDDPWTRIALRAEGDSLVGYLPHQPPAGKLEYFLELENGTTLVRVPEKETVVTRFKGGVPLGVLIPHVIAMFLAMLISTRAGIEAFRREGRPRTLVMITLVLLAIGGLILGPIVQKYAFGAYWTGFPWGTDLTDNKTLIAFIAWLAALWAVWKPDTLRTRPLRRWIVVGAAVVMLLVYLIPHSMMGSEIDYKEMDRQKAMENAAPTFNPSDTASVPSSPVDENAGRMQPQ